MPPHAPPAPGIRTLRWLLTALWLWTLVLTMQHWVGERTIYTEDNAPKVEAAHRMLLTNTPPDSGWGSIGMNGVNVRVVSVYLAEGLHQVLGRPVSWCYEMLDTVMLVAALALLLQYLRRFQPAAVALLAVSFIGALLPLTYQLFYYHPWDRLSLLTWVAMLMLLQRDELVSAALLLPFAVAVKYDIMLLPGVLGLQGLFRERRLTSRVVFQSGALLAVGIGTYVLLNLVLGGGNAPIGIWEQVLINLEEMRAMKLSYPPFLGFAVLLSATAIGFRSAGAWAQACATFGLLLFVPLVLRSNLAEFRAHMAIVVLLAPTAMAGVSRLLLEDGDRLSLAREAH